MNFEKQSGTAVDSLALKAGGETLNPGAMTVLSCGGMHRPMPILPTTELRWRDIIQIPGEQLSQRLFALNPVTIEWNPMMEEAIYAN